MLNITRNKNSVLKLTSIRKRMITEDLPTDSDDISHMTDSGTYILNTVKLHTAVQNRLLTDDSFF